MEQENPEVSCPHGKLNRAECPLCSGEDQVREMMRDNSPFVVERTSGAKEGGWRIERIMDGRVHLEKGGDTKQPRIEKFLAWQKDK